MGLRNTGAGWGWPARLLHWAMAALILFQLGFGLWMVRLVSDIYVQFSLYQTHKSWGFVIFALAVLRVLWRLANRAPDTPADTTPIEAALARGAHLALYLLMLALPLSGWLMASASPLQEEYGITNTVFGWFELPDPFQPGDKGLKALFESVHAWAAFGLAVLLVGHVAAALRHHFIRRDRVLTRMLLGR
jgi:cytochrome b561